MKEQMKYLRLLSEKFPTRQSVCTEIINLEAIMNLPKGTEHFMSDLHGEYESFYHIYNNCSGVIREKVDLIFGNRLGEKERGELCTLVYYPSEKLSILKKKGLLTPEWYKETLKQLIELAKLLSSKYTRSKVRKALPEDFGYIIDELLHAQPDEDNNRQVYHDKILNSIIEISNADEFIIALTGLIKRLAVDHLHIVGDIFDRGGHADRILDLLMTSPSLDIEWGNHDILWMGAASGSDACIANVLRNNIRYGNTGILEGGYGISLRPVLLFAEKYYSGTPMEAMRKAVNVILFKLEGQLILRHPEYGMQDRLLLGRIDFEKNTIVSGGKKYTLNTSEFPTLDRKNPYELTEGEKTIIRDLRAAFRGSERLNRHIGFLYAKGSMYKCCNGNLLFHGCVPMTEEGEFRNVGFSSGTFAGREYFDFADRSARQAYYSADRAPYLDFMWYLWSGKYSPLCGRNLKTFERTYIDDRSSWEEEQDPYYRYYREEKTCDRILREFGMNSELSHIINGHTPIHASEGESPVKAGGKLIVIDGGFCRAYRQTTGIAGYTLIYNSHGMRIKAHQPFESVEKALTENRDIESETNPFETEPYRVMVGNTDNGQEIAVQIRDLKELLEAYRQGLLTEKIKRR